jgi:hypothetical protein
MRDQDVAVYVASLGLPGIVDLHVHFMPERVQAKVWAHFDRLDPPWPIVYRGGPLGQRRPPARPRRHPDG